MTFVFDEKSNVAQIYNDYLLAVFPTDVRWTTIAKSAWRYEFIEFDIAYFVEWSVDAHLSYILVV